MKASTLKSNQVKIEVNPVPSNALHHKSEWCIIISCAPDFPDINFFDPCRINTESWANGERYQRKFVNTKLGAKFKVRMLKSIIKEQIKELKKDKRKGWTDTVEFNI